MEDEQSKNPPEEKGTPQDELEALLRQSQGAAPRTPDIRLPSGGKRSNLLLWGIVFLAIVLLAGTGYFVVRGLVFNKGEVVFELNEDEVNLSINGRDYGEIDSGAVVKLGAGEHTLRLVKSGFLELEQEFSLVRGEKATLQLELLPVPILALAIDKQVQYVRLNTDGSEISYYDPSDGVFKSVALETGKVTNLFRSSFTSVQGVVWSPTNQAAIVKLSGSPRLANALDHRNVRGAYVVLGERPSQGPDNFNGVSTWLFDDDQRTASGWQPIKLNDSIRETVFSADGGSILYVYEPADGEYSLVRAQPDGQEWERLINDLPKFSGPNFVWGQDDRYLLIRDQDKLLVGDLIAGDIEDVLGDWVPKSWFAVSPGGDKLAYIAQNSSVGLKMYDLVTEEPATLSSDLMDVEQNTLFVWSGIDSMIFAGNDQKFISVDIGKESRLDIPFLGTTGELHVREMQYSGIGKMLMVTADEGIFVMKV